MQALPYTLPAAAAGLAYLNARHALLNDWAIISSAVGNIVKASLHDRRDDFNVFYVLEKHAKSSLAENVFIIFHGRSWTYSQTYETALKYGTWLKMKGVRKNEIVAMDFVNSEVFIWVWFGLWSIGAKPAFINYNLTGASLIHSIRTSTARLVLVDEHSRDNFSEDVMAEHGFASRPPDADVPEGRQAKYGFDNDPSQVPQSVQKSLKTDEGSNPQRRKLEIIFFDKQLEDYILSLEPIRQPDSERDNQKSRDMAGLIFTSGTTGLPKAAVVPWAKFNLGARYMSGWIPVKPTDTLYTAMPLYHGSASILGVLPVLHSGASVCLGQKFSHKTFWPEVRASKATIIQYVGETLRYLLSAPKSELDKAHNVRAAFGNGLRPDVWEPFKERFNIPTIVEFYAATEAPAGFWNKATNTFSSGAVGRTGTLAKLLFGQTLAVVKMDPESEPPEPLRDSKTGFCKITSGDETGELLYKLDPDNMTEKFQGYFGNEKATDSKLLKNVKKKGDLYFRTGDLMRCDDEGRWYFVDRIGDTFRWKAENVSTAEVASAVGHHEAVDEANVFGVLVPRHDGRAGCAAVIMKNTSNADLETPLALPDSQTLKSLAEHVKKSLPAFAVPVFIRITREMDKTGTNKQQKHILRQDGIDVNKVEGHGDYLFWLRNGTYERFTSQDLEKIQGGSVKL